MIRIIHISDYHLESENGTHRKNKLTESFVKELEKHIDSNSIIAFTGDLVDKGGSNFSDKEKMFLEFENYFFKKIRDKFPDLPIVFVPGNHDCERLSDDEIIDAGLKASLTDKSHLTDFFQKKSSNPIFFKRLQKYKEYELKHLMPTAQRNLTNLESSIILNVDNKKVGISCLNSSWLCYDDSDCGKLLIGEDQIFRSLDFLKDCEVKIALVHHPIDFLSEFDRENIESIFSTEYDLILQGHTHKLGSKYIQDIFGNVFISQATSTIADNSDDKKFTNGFSVIDYDFTGTIKVQYIKYIDANHSFVPNTDTGSVDGTKTFTTNKIISETDNLVMPNELSQQTDSVLPDDILKGVRLLIEDTKSLNFRSTKEEIENLKSLQQKVFQALNIQDHIDNVPALMEENINILFNSIYSQEKLSRDTINEVNLIRSNPNYHWYHRSIIVSGLTLSVINFTTTDPQKIFLLIDFINGQENQVWQKAITGLTIALTYRKGWLRFPLVLERLNTLKSNELVRSALFSIAYILDNSLYKLFDIDKGFFNVQFFKDNPANCFLPFYDGNLGINKYYDVSEDENPKEVVEIIQKMPLPDSFKYFLCFTRSKFFYQTSANVDKAGYEVLASTIQKFHFFSPYIQFLTELYFFNNFYPSAIKNQVFSNSISIGNASIKDYLLKEIDRHIVQGDYFIQRKDYRTALTHLNKALEFDKQKIRILFSIASCHAKLDERNEEIIIRQRIYALDEKDVDNIAGLTIAYYNVSKNQQCIEFADLALKLDGKKSIIYQIKIQALCALQKFRPAIKCATEGLEHISEDSELYRQRAVAKVDVGNYKSALIDIDNAIKFFTLKDKNHLANLKIFRGVILKKLNRFEEALYEFDDAFSTGTKTSYLFSERAKTYIHLKKDDLAVMDFDKAVQLEDNNPRCLIDRADYYLSINHRNDALNDYKAAIKMYSTFNRFKENGKGAYLFTSEDMIHLQIATIYFYLNKEIEMFQALKEAAIKGLLKKEIPEFITEKYKLDSRYLELFK